MKVQFNENIYDMYQCPPNPGFTSNKVQNVDFLIKPSVDNFVYILELLTSVNWRAISRTLPSNLKLHLIFEEMVTSF